MVIWIIILTVVVALACIFIVAEANYRDEREKQLNSTVSVLIGDISRLKKQVDQIAASANTAQERNSTELKMQRAVQENHSTVLKTQRERLEALMTSLNVMTEYKPGGYQIVPYKEYATEVSRIGEEVKS